MAEPPVRSVDLAALHRPLQSELLAVTERVLDRGRFVLADEVEAFEQEWATACDAPFAVGVGSGLDALVLSLEALGVGAGDEVLVPSNTYIATWLAISIVGAVPVPVEPEVSTHLISPAAARARIGPATAAILPVHLYGRPVDVDGFEHLAAHYDLALVFDAAQAHGASVGGRRLGGRGDATAWSFYPTKNLGALGDGGAVTTQDPSVAATIRTLRNYGSDRRHHFACRGHNSRLDEIQAAYLRVKLAYLDGWVERRRAIAGRYAVGLAASGLHLPTIEAPDESAWHQFVVRSEDRERVRSALTERGIETDVHYPVPPHRQEAYRDLADRLGPLPIADRLATEVLSLPVRAELDDGDVDRVIAAVLEVV